MKLPTQCSECGGRLPPRTTKPHLVCGAKCARARHTRQKAEARAYAVENRKADEANAQHLKEAFGPGGDLEPGVFRRGHA